MEGVEPLPSRNVLKRELEPLGCHTTGASERAGRLINVGGVAGVAHDRKDFLRPVEGRGNGGGQGRKDLFRTCFILVFWGDVLMEVTSG